MSYQHLQNTLKAIALTVPAARAFELTVEFALGELAHNEGHVLFRQVLRSMARKSDLEPVTYELSMARLLAGRFDETVSKEPPLHHPTRNFGRHR